MLTATKSQTAEYASDQSSDRTESMYTDETDVGVSRSWLFAPRPSDMVAIGPEHAEAAWREDRIGRSLLARGRRPSFR